MHHVPLATLILLSGMLFAAEPKPEVKSPNKPAEPAPAAGPPMAQAPAIHLADPTAAIVAEGKYVYRQRDLDALMLIAARHAKVRFDKAEQDRLRKALTTALMAREPLMDALTALPSGFMGPARDALVLDLLDYEAEAATTTTAQPTATGELAQTPTTTSTSSPSHALEAPAANANGPLLIRLPALNLVRTLPGIGKRHLTLTIALFFHDPAQANKLQDRAPLVQDAILSHVQALSPAQFVEPNQLMLKDGITAAVIAKVPEFPSDAVLIPEMEAGEGEGSNSKKTTAP